MRLAFSGAFDAALTFECGQTFCWEREPGGQWLGVVGQRAVRLSVSAGAARGQGDFPLDSADSESRERELLLAHAAPEDEQFWRGYLDLDRDYGALAREFAGEPKIIEAFARYPGMRLLRQPVYETLIAFIVSANNNTGRIARILREMRAALGTPLPLPGGSVRAFPDAATLAQVGEEQLRALGLGYRAPYVRETARIVSGGLDLDALCRTEYEQAAKVLCALPGVGPKVADCVLLFSCGHDNAIPVDVWIDRVLHNWFFPDIKSRAQRKRAAIERFGPRAGIAQQYLFHMARMDGA